MAKVADVVVIGGGCAGAATTYFLAREGVSVILIEKENLASGCTGHGTGISRLNLRDTDNDAHAELSQRHIARLARIAPILEEETGFDVHYQVGPGMNVPLTDEAWEKMQAVGETEDGHVPLSAKAAHELEPGLGPDIPGVLWQPYRPRISGPRLTRAYAKAAELRGAEIRVGVEATGFELENGRVIGVHTSEGLVYCGAVVIAMGVGAAKAGQWLGVNIPVKPIKGEALRLTYSGPRAQHSLSPEGLRPGFVEQGHVLFRRDGIVSVGSTTENTGFEDQPTEAARDRLMRMALHLWPALENAEIKHHVHGLRPVPIDGIPILGPVTGYEGAYMLSGHAAVAHSAIYAEITRDMVMKGRTEVISSIEPFLLDRFEKGPVQAYGLMRETYEAESVVLGRG
jgi:glycine oxidase